MRLRNLRRLGWAGWLGVVALGLYALVPIHFAFDLAEALGPAHEEQAPVVGHNAERGLLALLTGHLDVHSSPGHHHKHHRHDCPVCSSLSLAGFAPAASPVLPVSVLIAAATAVATVTGAHDRAPALAYHSRAPPLHLSC
jgi:Protein of unknown function (DUF2946)